MRLFDQIIEKIGRGEYEFTKHATDQSIIRSVSVRELEEAFQNDPLVIEDYPHDKYGPSCLVLGFTHPGRPLHVQVSYPHRSLLKIITLYEPNPTLWIDYRVRQSR